jgi:lipopolysaccharide/colanic/teichoic acid biosynthesis glycosyltransferase
MIKRITDIIFSLIGIIVLFPVFIVIVIIIKIDSRGPIFYLSERIGKNEKPFTILKFRTMIPDAEKSGLYCTASNDKRITRVGRKIRRLKIDELPQLINILKGEMSFVGPRPDIKKYLNLISKKDRDIIFSVRPGITDISSLFYSQEGDILMNSLNPEKEYIEKILPHKIQMQKEYVHKMSFLLDLKIVIKTIIKIFKK